MLYVFIWNIDSVFFVFFAKTIYVRSRYNIMEWCNCGMSFKNSMKILKDIWDRSGEGSLVCPQCHGSLTMIQVEPVYDSNNPYTPYKTVIECSSCSFQLITESFAILGSVKSFDSHNIEIASWSPSGSRVVSVYEHILGYELLKELQNSAELVEFLVVNKQVVQVIG